MLNNALKTFLSFTPIETVSFIWLFRFNLHEIVDSLYWDHTSLEIGPTKSQRYDIVIEIESIREEKTYQSWFHSGIYQSKHNGNYADAEAQKRQSKSKPTLKSFSRYSGPLIDLHFSNLIFHKFLLDFIGPDCTKSIDGWDEPTNNGRIGFSFDSQHFSLSFHVVLPQLVTEENHDHNWYDHIWSRTIDTNW